MPKKIISEDKKNIFIKACEDIDPLKVLPEKLLRARQLTEMLSRDEIEATMLYKCGCPCEWVKSSYKYCDKNDTKTRKPRYSNDCTRCWVDNITEDVTETDYLESKQELLSKLNNFEKFRLTSEQLEQILSILDWDKTYDFDKFVLKIKKIKSQYSEKDE